MAGHKRVVVESILVPLTQEEQEKRNTSKKMYRQRMKEQDPEAWKAREKERNRQTYLRRKQRLADAKEQQTQPDEQKTDV